MDGLKPGRIVYVRNSVSGADAPAIVTRVHADDRIDATIFHVGSEEHAFGLPFAAEAGEIRGSGRSWHWMFEGQSTRYQPDRVETAKA